MFRSLFSPLMGDVADGLWFPEAASTFAEEVDGTYDMILWISVVFFIGILIPLVYFPLKYAKQKGGKATSRVRHHNLLEISWSVFPSFLLIVMFIRGSWGYLEQREVPAGATEIGVTAFQWGWSFDYGNGLTNPELHVVVNEPTRLLMKSSDVIHSLFVPAFRIKRDVVPGRYSVLWFEATKASEQVSPEELAAAKEKFKKENNGVFDAKVAGFNEYGYKYYDLYCTEYCGKDHSIMQTVVVVHETKEDLQKWLTDIDKIPVDMAPEDYGRKMYEQQGCKSCHSLDGTRLVGPTFLNLYGSTHGLAAGGEVTVDEDYIRESILDPSAKIVAGYQPAMPSYKGRLSDEKIATIIAFLKSLKQ